MRVVFGVLARYAEVDPDSGLIIVTGGGVDVFGVENLPVQFTMPFVLQLRYPESEAGQSRQVTMHILDPNLTPIGEAASFEIAPKPGEYHAAGWEGIFAVTGMVHLMADSFGTHSVQIRIDGEVAADIPYQLVQAPPSN